MKLTRWFKVNGEDREFMYIFGATSKLELEPFIQLVQNQGDLYRITPCTRNGEPYYEIWDARR